MHRLLVGLLLLTLTAPAASASVDTPGSAVAPGVMRAQLDDQELAMTTLINDYRAANGLGPLTPQGQLMVAAEQHAQDQAVMDSGSTHTGSDGSTDLDRVVRAGYSNWRSEAENVAYYSADGSAYAAFEGWRNSPGHNANMLGAGYTDIGVGRAQSSSGGWYWTAVFGSHW
jgi:uncharacterized protein YkwD